ncbi:hypothetical protein FH972_025882 [Carpinus fangiana]|uniref:Uncharacterized protein n=1 Tax=Carpinus fangiana TaxID=176857 RepID=A0A5N6L2B0_9ROSI|nr:hypothetical protein FH972_025882 [Carpinus fangiana]
MPCQAPQRPSNNFDNPDIAVPMATHWPYARQPYSTYQQSQRHRLRPSPMHQLSYSNSSSGLSSPVQGGTPNWHRISPAPRPKGTASLPSAFPSHHASTPRLWHPQARHALVSTQIARLVNQIEDSLPPDFEQSVLSPCSSAKPQLDIEDCSNYPFSPDECSHWQYTDSSTTDLNTSYSTDQGTVQSVEAVPKLRRKPLPSSIVKNADLSAGTLQEMRDETTALLSDVALLRSRTLGSERMVSC